MIRKHDRFTSPGNIILYSDVDGTLVSKSNQIPEKVVRYIQLFIDSGFGFSLATGRSFQSVRRILEKIPVNVPVVLCNGTYVMDTVKNKYWWTSIDKLIIEHILK
jgi:HAD superfamily hydrolase (TIGR01484 family)